ncbi:lipase secretion chaperone [Stutzerimonas chloritidismutans]|uniref:lipase secretion chaperone n=1 Tax=Stutzerimonas chloritidismutans TaxID=203192 RepID=UPI003F1573B5
MKILALLFVLAAAGGFVIFGQRDAPGLQPDTALKAPPIQVGAHNGEAAPAPNRAEPTPEKVGRLPASFIQTQLDGSLQVDTAGNLVVDQSLRQRFDYFLSAIGEEPLETSVGRLRRHLETQLMQPARSQALDLLGRYLDYKRRLLQLESAHPVQPDLAALHARLEAAERLRRELFSEQAHRAFFADEEALDRSTLQRLAIRQDPLLDARTKGEALDRLLKQAPTDWIETLAPTMHTELSEQTRILQASGGTPEALRALRQQWVGNEATKRLEQLDTDRQAWRQRLVDYLSEKSRIERSRGLSDIDKRAAVTRLAEERFNDAERLRLAAAQELAAREHD